MTERLHLQITTNTITFGLDFVEVWDLLDASCEQSVRDTMKHLLKAVFALRDRQNAPTDIAVYEEMLASGTISAIAMDKIKTLVDPVTIVAAPTGQ